MLSYPLLELLSGGAIGPQAPATSPKIFFVSFIGGDFFTSSPAIMQASQRLITICQNILLRRCTILSNLTVLINSFFDSATASNFGQLSLSRIGNAYQALNIMGN